MTTQTEVKTDEAPIWVIGAVGDAIFDALCPGIRFTQEDDARYAEAARDALNVCGYSKVMTALEELADAVQMEADGEYGVSGPLASALKDARAVLGWEE